MVLLYKLMQNVISGNVLSVITKFLCQGKQRVILNGRHSPWSNVEAGGLQGSIIGLLFILIYITDLSDGLISNSKLFADGTSLVSLVQNVN